MNRSELIEEISRPVPNTTFEEKAHEWRRIAIQRGKDVDQCLAEIERLKKENNLMQQELASFTAPLEPGSTCRVINIDGRQMVLRGHEPETTTATPEPSSSGWGTVLAVAGVGAALVGLGAAVQKEERKQKQTQGAK